MLYTWYDIYHFDSLTFTTYILIVEFETFGSIPNMMLTTSPVRSSFRTCRGIVTLLLGQVHRYQQQVSAGRSFAVAGGGVLFDRGVGDKRLRRRKRKLQEPYPAVRKFIPGTRYLVLWPSLT